MWAFLFYEETSMITKEQLYKEFCVDILFKRRFHYYFTDGTDMIVEFWEWGVYHMYT